MRISDTNEQSFYEIEAYENNWSLRELQRQFDTALLNKTFLTPKNESKNPTNEK